MNNAKSVIYQTPTGQSAQGYIIDGKTYKDQGGTQRVDIGSTVPTAGGTFTLTANGGVKTPGSVSNDIRNAYNSSLSHLGAANNARVQGISTATNKQLASIKDQRKTAERQYEDANRKAYQSYVSASNPYGVAEERMAKLGLSNSGYSETSKMRLANTYQQAINANTLARDEYLRELDTAYRNAVYDGDIAKANAIADYEKLVYQHGIDAAETIAAQDNAAYTAGMNANRDVWERNVYEREQAIAEQERRWEREQALKNWMLSLAKAGFSNADIAKTLGVSVDQLYRVVNGR